LRLRERVASADPKTNTRTYETTFQILDAIIVYSQPIGIYEPVKAAKLSPTEYAKGVFKQKDKLPISFPTIRVKLSEIRQNPTIEVRQINP